MQHDNTYFQGGMLVSLSFSKPGNSRKVEIEDLTAQGAEVEADRDWVRFRKSLLESTELGKVTGCYLAMKSFIVQRSAPAKFFRAGCYLVKTDAVGEITERFSQAQQELAEAVEKFLVVYPERKAEAKEKLGTLYNESDYPTADQFRAAVRMRLQVIEMNVPQALKAIDPVAYKAQLAQADADWKKALEEVRLALRQGMLELVSHLADRLAPDADGDKKVIRQSSFSKLESFLDHFATRDITKDGEMASIVSQARSLLSKVDVEAVRDSAGLRSAVCREFEGVKKQLSGMVEQQRGRLIEL